MTRTKQPRPAPRSSRPPSPSNPPAPAKRAPSRLLIASFFFLLAIPLYGNTLGNRYAVDDAMVITDNAFTKRGVQGIPDIFAHESFQGYPMVQKNLVSGGRYRPLSIATFALEYQVAGAAPGLNHFFNLVLYGVTGALLYLLLARLFRSDARTRWWMAPAFLVTLVYMVHPLHTEIVANIKGRDEILAFLFALAAFHGFLSYYERAGRGPLDLLAGGFFMFMGLLSKESALPFLAIIPLGLWFFRRADWRRMGIVVGALILPIAVYFAARTVFAGPMTITHTVDLLNDPFAFASFQERLGTIFKTFGIYLRLFLFPHPLTHDYYYNQVPLTGVGHPSSVLPAAIALGLAIVAAAGTPRKSPIAFGLLFFAIGFSMVSNLAFSIGTTMAERFLYIPSLGLATAFVFTLDGVSKRPLGRAGPRAAAILLIVLSAAFSAKTIVRNFDWKDNFTLFTADLEASSRSAKERGDLASTLAYMAGEEKDPIARQRLTDDAVLHFRKAVEIYPEHSLAWFGLGNILIKQGGDKLPEAIECYRRVVSLEPRRSAAYLGLALAADQSGDHATALSSFRHYRSLNPGGNEADLLEAEILEHAGQMDTAIGIYEDLARRDPRSAAAWAGAGRLIAGHRQQYARAVEFLGRAIALDSTNVSYYTNLGSAQILAGQPRSAVRTLEHALVRFGDTHSLNWALAGAWQKLGDQEKAARYFARAKQLSGSSP